MASKPSLLSFGDVFRHGEGDYVYLAHTDDIFYTAKILNKEDTYIVKNAADRFMASPRKATLPKPLVYCFIMLDTKELKDRMAPLVNTDTNKVSVYIDKYMTLNNKDRAALKDLILDDETSVPEGLKKLVKDVHIPKD